jgi:hypothetical protein
MLGVSSGYAAFLKRIYFDMTGSSMIQGVSTNPDRPSADVISDDDVKKGNDILVYSADGIWRFWDLGDLVVLRDLLFMVDIVLGGALSYGVHIIYELRKISELEERALMVRELP